MGFSETFQEILLPAIGQTFYMVMVSTILAVIIGFIPAILLVVTEPGGLKPNKAV